MEKKRKASLTFSVVALALMVSLAVGLFMQSSVLTPISKLLVYAQSNPDSYGNQISWVKIYQIHGASHDVVRYITDSNYTSGMTLEVDANYETYLKIRVLLSDTLASDIMDAEAKTRVYLTVSGIFTNELLDAKGSGSGPAGFYWIEFGDQTYNWATAADTVYECTVKYEAYY